MKNLYGDKKYNSILVDLKTQLQKLIDQYDDEEAKGVLEKE